VLLFGGSFDPPHRWHVKVARAASRHLFGRKGWVVFVPAARSPLKDAGPVAPPEDRVRMLRLATRRMPNAFIWTDEIDRGRGRRVRSYTIDTLERFWKAWRGRGAVNLLIGADQAAQFTRWRRWQELMVIAGPMVVWRPPITSPRRLARALSRAGGAGPGVDRWLSQIIPAPIDPASSSRVRTLLARMYRHGRVPKGLAQMLDPSVLRYIRKGRLYAPGVSARPS
jgi:nicotinate-nucleotide adenylyltransferase